MRPPQLLPAQDSTHSPLNERLHQTRTIGYEHPQTSIRSMLRRPTTYGSQPYGQSCVSAGSAEDRSKNSNKASQSTEGPGAILAGALSRSRLKTAWRPARTAFAAGRHILTAEGSRTTRTIAVRRSTTLSRSNRACPRCAQRSDLDESSRRSAGLPTVQTSLGVEV